MSSGIDKITNKINNNCYIGSSKQIEKRWNKHLSNSNNPKSKEYNYPICKAIRKYRKENFDFEILEIIEKIDFDTLIKREQFYYDLVKPEYNQMRPDFVPSYNPNEVDKKQRSIKYTGIKNPFYGKKHNQETKEKLSKNAKLRVRELNPFYGKKHSKEVIDKLKEIKGIEVVAIDFSGKEFYFKNAKEAGNWCREIGLTKSKTPNSDIIKVCKGKKEKAFTFYWRYK